MAVQSSTTVVMMLACRQARPSEAIRFDVRTLFLLVRRAEIAGRSARAGSH